MLQQAGSAVLLARVVLNFFEKPGSAEAVKKAREEVKNRAAAVKAHNSPRREDWLAVSRGLSDLADEAGWAVDEAGRLAVEGGRFLTEMARGVVGAAEEIGAALEALNRGSQTEPHLLKAKGRALEVERLYRKARADLLFDSEVVKGLKTGAIYRRFSQSAEAAQKAADRLGELLAVI